MFTQVSKSQDSCPGPQEPPEEHEPRGPDGRTRGCGCRSGKLVNSTRQNCSGELVERKGERDDAARVQVNEVAEVGQFAFMAQEQQLSSPVIFSSLALAGSV